MYLIVLSSPPPVKKIKDETRCLCLKDKAQAVCYGQTLASWQGEEERRRGGEGVAGCEGIIIQAPTEILHKHTHTCCTQPLKSQLGELQKVQQHINKSLPENLQIGLIFWFPYLCSQRLEAMVCFHHPLRWAALWRQIWG